MLETNRIRSTFRLVTLAEFREEHIGPIQIQLLALAAFLLPLAHKLAYRLGLPRPESHWLRGVVLVVTLVLMCLMYHVLCRYLGIPTTNQDAERRHRANKCNERQQ